MNPIPPSSEPSFGKLLDLGIPFILGDEEEGMEAEYQRLQEPTARWSRIVPTNAQVSVIEWRKE